MAKIGKKTLVIQRNELIEAAYKLTLAEKRLVIVLISLVTDKESGTVHTISMAGYLKYLQLSSNSGNARTRAIAKRLISKAIEIDMGNGSILICNWFSSVIFNQGQATFRFDENLRPYLIDISRKFTKYELKNVLSLSSVYSIRLYELLKQYQPIGKRRFEVEELRRILGIEDQYPKYADFKRKTILHAQQELIEKTDISFDFEEIKSGKAVTSIKFVIRENSVDYEALESAKAKAKQAKKKSALTPEEIEYYKTEFLKEKKSNKIIMGKYRKEGFENVTVKNTFDDWLSKKIA